MKSGTLIIALLAFTFPTHAQTKPSFSYKAYGNFANFFESEKDLLNFFEFKKGDIVAEIGAGDGQNIAGLSILTDSITFYVQDINAAILNQKNFDKLIKRSNKCKSSVTNTFHLVIGTEKSSSLPNGMFDKIFLSASFHEFTFMDEMIIDISKKLKPNGKLYILESDCLMKSHKNYTSEETTSILKKNGFRLVKKDGKDINSAKGIYRMVFEKDI